MKIKGVQDAEGRRRRDWVGENDDVRWDSWEALESKKWGEDGGHRLVWMMKAGQCPRGWI